MTKSKLIGLIGAAGVGAGLALSAPAANAQTTLTMTHPFPDFLIYTKLCKALAADITKSSNGMLKINVLPFNSIKMFQQSAALRAGRIDMMCIPAAFYARALPENEAISTSNTTPEKVRANGGYAMIDQLHQKHFNAKYLGWTSAGGKFRVYMKNPPKWSSKGLPDFSGVKLRDNPIYGAFFKAMGATTHPMPATAAYAALEKGVVDAAAWATIGLKGLKWDKFLRHAIEPEFYQTDIGWSVNLRKWKSLKPEAQKHLQAKVIAAEGKHRAILEDLAKKERAALLSEGMKFHTAPNPAAYSKLAVDSAYDRMKGRLKGKKGREGNPDKLRSMFIQ